MWESIINSLYLHFISYYLFCMPLKLALEIDLIVNDGGKS